MHDLNEQNQEYDRLINERLRAGRRSVALPQNQKLTEQKKEENSEDLLLEIYRSLGSISKTD